MKENSYYSSDDFSMYADGDMEGTNYAVAVVSPTFIQRDFA